MEIIGPILLLGLFALFLFAIAAPVYYLVRGGRKSERQSVKRLCWVGAGIVTAADAFLVCGIVGFLFPFRRLPVLFAATALSLILLWAIRIFRPRKKAVLSMCAVMLLAFAASGTLLGMEILEGLIPTVAEGGANIHSRYNPLNEFNELVTLDEPATLRITENIPRLDGATALYPVYAAFANAVYPMENYAYPDNFDPADPDTYPPEDPLQLSTTAYAYERLVDGETDVIFVAAPSEEQLQYAADNGEEMIFTPIGREAFVFFVNAENPVDSLTPDQLRGIYSGEITRWDALGADLGPIRAFQREEGSGSQSAMIRFMGGTALTDAPREEIMDSMAGVINTVADYRNHKNAIGYSFRFYSTEMVRNNQIKLLQIGSVAPTKENILNGSYPISSEFYAVHLASNDNPNISLLLDWILSEQGQTLIDRTGYVALK